MGYNGYNRTEETIIDEVFQRRFAAGLSQLPNGFPAVFKAGR